MALDLVDLEEATRRQMVEELDHDLAADALYLSPRLSAEGQRRYRDLLREAMTKGDDDSLADALASPGIFNEAELSHSKTGKPFTKKVPHNANATLAEGEFNRFYLRGLCQRALAEGGDRIVIYRARESSVPRPESEAMIGTSLDPSQLLADLREHTGVDTALGLPPGPNSGLSGRLSA